MSIASIIVYVSLITGAPCHQVFIDTALLVNPRAVAEMEMLKSFATVSCQTDNPDLLWQLAYVESSFQFDMVRVNNGADDFKILVGKQAKAYLKTLKKNGPNINADLGVIQMNWAAHKKGYGYDSVKMIQPAAQVEYLVNQMVSSLTGKCGKNWVGCYHSWANGERAANYRKQVEKAGPTLRKYATEVYRLRKKTGHLVDRQISSRGAGKTIVDEIFATGK